MWHFLVHHEQVVVAWDRSSISHPPLPNLHTGCFEYWLLRSAVVSCAEIDAPLATPVLYSLHVYLGISTNVRVRILFYIYVSGWFFLDSVWVIAVDDFVFTQVSPIYPNRPIYPYAIKWQLRVKSELIFYFMEEHVVNGQERPSFSVVYITGQDNP